MPYKPEFFSGFLFATAKVPYITAMIILHLGSCLHLILHSAVHIWFSLPRTQTSLSRWSLAVHHQSLAPTLRKTKPEEEAVIFIYSNLLYIFCFILLFTSSSPCRKNQLPCHIYFSTKYCFMLHVVFRFLFLMAWQLKKRISRGETRWSELAAFVGQERVQKQHKNISLRGMYTRMAVLM